MYKEEDFTPFSFGFNLNPNHWVDDLDESTDSAEPNSVSSDRDSGGGGGIAILSRMESELESRIQNGNKIDELAEKQSENSQFVASIENLSPRAAKEILVRVRWKYINGKSFG